MPHNGAVQILLAAICDFASDYQGKLCILGAFDTLCTREFPVAHPQCSFTLRLCFDPEDQGSFDLVIRGLGPEDEDIMPPCKVPMEVSFPPGGPPFLTRNVVLNFQRLKFEKPGLYRFVAERDEEELTSVPMRVVLLPEERAGNGGPFG